MSNVWIGLIKSNEEGDFTWTDYKALSGEGYWASAPEGGRTPLCAALDPARDYRWGALSCGGPQVASFICELPVPAWALKPAGGCLVRSLPSLTVQFLPELAAVQLISDCGLDGTKKVTCKANESHSDILKELSCAISEEDFSDNSVTGVSSVEASSGSPRPSPPGAWSWAPSTPSTGELSTRIRRETIPPSTPRSIHTTMATPGSHIITAPQPTQVNQPATGINSNTQFPLLVTNGPILRQSTMHSKIFDDSSVSENPKKATVTTIPLESSSINIVTVPKIISFNTDKDIAVNATPKAAQATPKRKEKERHDIFTQATDHFIPPLVMAKSKLSADMTVVSPETKHQQYIIAHHLHQLYKTNEQIETTNLPTVINKIGINKPTESLTIPTSTSVVTENVVETIKVTAEAVESNMPTTIKSKGNTSATSKEQSVSYSKQTPPTLETDSINQVITDKSKYRKPSKGKKYDKLKEEKKKYKDITTESASIVHKIVEVKNPEEPTHKMVEVKVPEESTRKAAEVKLVDESTHKVLEVKVPEELTHNAVEVKIPSESTHKVVEVKIPDVTGTNIPTILEITTKLSEHAVKLQPITTKSVSGTTSTMAPLRKGPPTVNTTDIVEKGILIDPNIMKLNKEGSINNESETIHPTLLEVPKVIESNTSSTQTQNEKVSTPNKSLVLINHTNVSKVDEIKKEKDLDNSEETVEQNPEPLPRPNRSRTLTQTPQHRSFYPYFFNRVLG